MELTLGQIAELVGGRLAGRADRAVRRVASLDAAGEGDLTFVTDGAYLARFLDCPGACAILPPGLEAPGRDVVHHDNPRAAVAILLESLDREPVPEPGVDPTASVDPSAVLGRNVSVGPFAVIGPDVTLGDEVVVRERVSIRASCRVGARSVLNPGVVLYPRVTLGADCRIHANSVIGADGFGYTAGGATHRKIPHVGGVEIGDRVEVGANACIDGGMLDPTRIGDDTKIDNLVQVGHNCRIGKRVLLCGQVGIAGSTEIGDDVVLAGQVGVADHVTIGAGSMGAAACAILHDLPPRSMVGGVPAHDIKSWRRETKALKALPELLKTVRELRRRLREADAASDA